ncbi:ABC transporter permease [Microbacterium caowuchunii]|uniref:ABC transporter permease n=1 Tax=Microbacterium caowuchunii TaxID=2614638 RepID=A0A5J6KV91_9MICO|nr:ABC transporter permease [Microbacterium caowuchunii]KAA9132140.1 ABC transporter permease [Microbacterium caowuchunii]QEW01116.1 ABC transporter permease [Microbacterium caowuchunii]
MKGTVLHIGRLVLSSLILFVAVLTTLFFLLEIAPGDPVQSLVGDSPVSEDFRAQMVASFGLDRPLGERYLIFLGNIFTGNLGYSFGTSTTVTALIADRVGNTIALALPAFIISTIGGIVLGTIAARTRSKALDGTISGLSVALFSIPNFWLGLLLLMVFSMWLGWLPTQGMSPYGQEGIAIQYLVLPVITMATTELAYKTRIMRSAVIEALGQDYIDTARSKGLSDQAILWRHAMPNALLPMVTVAGYSLGLTFAGSVVVERVFGWPGMGLLLYDAVQKQNNQVVLGCAVLITITIIVINLVTDIVYGIVDPRLRARLFSTGRAS